MNMSMPTVLAVFVGTAVIFGSFGIDIGYTSETKSQISLDAPPEHTLAALSAGGGATSALQTTDAKKDTPAAASTVVDAAPALQTTGAQFEDTPRAASAGVGGAPALQKTAGSPLAKVKPVNPSDDTTERTLAELKTAASSEDTTWSALSEVQAVEPIEGPIKPKHNQIVGNSPAARQFAAQQALKLYWQERALRKGTEPTALLDNEDVTKTLDLRTAATSRIVKCFKQQWLEVRCDLCHVHDPRKILPSYHTDEETPDVAIIPWKGTHDNCFVVSHKLDVYRIKPDENVKTQINDLVVQNTRNIRRARGSKPTAKFSESGKRVREERGDGKRYKKEQDATSRTQPPTDMPAITALKHKSFPNRSACFHSLHVFHLIVLLLGLVV